MQALFNTLAAQWAAQSPWEIVAVVLALAYVWLAARQSIWCWPCALVSTAIYTWLFWQYALPFQSVLNAYYLLMALYGWWQWRQYRQAQNARDIISWSLQRHVVAIVALGIATGLLAITASHWFASQLLLLDVFVTVFSVFATFLVTQKVLENWWYWLVIDAAAAVLYFHQGLMLTGLLFVAYLGMALYGLRQWQGDYQQQWARA